MLRPYIVSGAGLEPFCDTKPHHPIFSRPVERMHDIHLADRITQQIQTERDPSATHEFARPAEDLGFGAVGPRDAGVIEDACLDWQRAVITPTEVEQPEGRKAQLDIPHEHLAAHELIEDRAARSGGVVALTDVEAADVI